MKYFFALVEVKAFSFATQHAMPPELGGRCGAECLSTKFLLIILLCAGYSVKLYNFFNNILVLFVVKFYKIIILCLENVYCF